MLVQYVVVTNDSERSRWLKDLQLPGARVLIEPGATLQIPYGVWLRNRRRHASWLKQLEVGRGFAHVAKKAKPVAAEAAPAVKKTAKRKRKPKAKATVETPATTALVADGNAATVVSATTVPTASKPLEEASMSRVKEIAAGLGIKWEIGMSKAALIAAIREKRQAGNG